MCTHVPCIFIIPAYSVMKEILKKMFSFLRKFLHLLLQQCYLQKRYPVLKYNIVKPMYTVAMTSYSNLGCLIGVEAHMAFVNYSALPVSSFSGLRFHIGGTGVCELDSANLAVDPLLAPQAIGCVHEAALWLHLFWDCHWFRALDPGCSFINTSLVTVVLRNTFLGVMHKFKGVLNLPVLWKSQCTETGSF